MFERTETFHELRLNSVREYGAIKNQDIKKLMEELKVK